jgi:hypothetical protein
MSDCKEEQGEDGDLSLRQAVSSQRRGRLSTALGSHQFPVPSEASLASEAL